MLKKLSCLLFYRKKLTALTLLFLFFFNYSISQNTRVVYKNVFDDQEAIEQNLKENKDNLAQYILELISANFKKIINEEFELIFDKKMNIYQKIEKLSSNDIVSNNFDLNNIYYKNIETKEKIFQSQKTGQTTNVQVKFDQYNWDITTEIKTISGYKCFKAATVIKDYDQLNKKEIILKRIAWFTPEIPASFGPEGFDGLPGLVLETSVNEKVRLQATKIEFNYKPDFKIEKPNCNNTISEKEFNEIMGKYLDNILDEN